MPAPGSRSRRARSRRDDAAAARELRRRFEYPTPRVEFGMAARGIASAAMDLVRWTGGRPAEARQPPAASRRTSTSTACRCRARLQRGRGSGAGARLGARRRRRLRAAARGAARRASTRSPPAPRQLNLRLTAIGELRRGNARARGRSHGAELRARRLRGIRPLSPSLDPNHSLRRACRSILCATNSNVAAAAHGYP